MNNSILQLSKDDTTIERYLIDYINSQEDDAYLTMLEQLVIVLAKEKKKLMKVIENIYGGT